MKTIESDTLSRRQLFPLLGGAVALATVAPNSTAADPSGPFGKPPAAKARFVYVAPTHFRELRRVVPTRARQRVSMCSG